jgi:L-asparaginase II
MFWDLAGVPAVAVTRGERIESVHAVAACVCDARGALELRVGTIETPVFLRSAAKPFIAAAAVRAGIVERFGFGDKELAVMSASHNGEPNHTRVVANMLKTIGARVEDLRCGAHAPQDDAAAHALAERGEAPSPLHNNCSGKHAGILALARILDAPLEGYLDVAHPAQQAILALCERLSGETFASDRLGIDGCGIPVYATSLHNAAMSFARFATFDEVDDADAGALARVGAAMAAEPWYVAGTGRFDTALIEATRGRVLGKAGAEGVHGDALLDAGVGVAVKVIDGARRAAAPATMSVLDSVRAVPPAARKTLEPFARASLRNVAGDTVGEVYALDGWLAGGIPEG